MGAWSELQARDKLAEYFISTDPLDITLHRPTFSSTSAGGRIRSGQDTLAPQRFHIYPFKRRLTVETKFNPQTYGEEKVEYIHWIMMFTRDQNIEVDDEFNPSVDTNPPTDRLRRGLYIVTFISARLWDRGQAGLLFRG